MNRRGHLDLVGRYKFQHNSSGSVFLRLKVCEKLWTLWTIGLAQVHVGSTTSHGHARSNRSNRSNRSKQPAKWIQQRLPGCCSMCRTIPFCWEPGAVELKSCCLRLEFQLPGWYGKGLGSSTQSFFRFQRGTQFFMGPTEAPHILTYLLTESLVWGCRGNKFLWSLARSKRGKGHELSETRNFLTHPLFGHARG